MVAHPLKCQGEFLELMGIGQRVEMLGKQNQGKMAQMLEKQYERLCHPGQMGKIYKLLFLGHKDYKRVYPFIEGEEDRVYS